MEQEYDRLVIMDACADAFITSESESTPCAANKMLNQSLNKIPSVPLVYALSPPYPNPATSFTNINYALPEESEVIISISNNSGGNIVQLLNTPQTAGYKTVSWNLNDDSDQRLESGIYILRFSAGDYMAEKELQIIDYSIDEDAETYANEHWSIERWLTNYSNLDSTESDSICLGNIPISIFYNNSLYNISNPIDIGLGWTELWGNEGDSIAVNIFLPAIENGTFSELNIQVIKDHDFYMSIGRYNNLFSGWDDYDSVEHYDNCGFEVLKSPNRFEYLNGWSPNWIGNAY